MNLKADNEGVNKLLRYHEQIDFYNKQMAEAVKAYSCLLELMAEQESLVRCECMSYLKDNEDKQKVALEKVELLACNTEKAVKTEHMGDDANMKAVYLELVKNRITEHGLRRVITGISGGLSSIQSKMSYDKALDYAN